jgi:hypothetical protein
LKNAKNRTSLRKLAHRSARRGLAKTLRCGAAVGQSGAPHTVDVLLPDLQDPDWRVRRNAVQALGALKSKDSVNAILEALKDRVATVRERAAVALGRIKDPFAIPALIEALVEGKGARIHINKGAYQSIRKFGRKAGPALVEALKTHPNIYLLELFAESNCIGRFVVRAHRGCDSIPIRRPGRVINYQVLGKQFSSHPARLQIHFIKVQTIAAAVGDETNVFSGHNIGRGNVHR